MFNRKRPKTKLEKAVDRALDKLEVQDISSEEYASILDHISKLHKMKEEEIPDPVSKDTVALIAANLLGIILILNHERLNFINSKALSFVANAKPH